jgi:hypothetical protein
MRAMLLLFSTIQHKARERELQKEIWKAVNTISAVLAARIDTMSTQER